MIQYFINKREKKMIIKRRLELSDILRFVKNSNQIALGRIHHDHFHDVEKINSLNDFIDIKNKECDDLLMILINLQKI
ncbi:unnamed protein product [Paramecium pentaurelia]|uniref:Uncharacterized protein n=1 Tax=Paramecium pentaurelia TaxID=43138 RepID=A0A8S1YQ86_9CILI|nr:unnamed protein product [Paramecium pentaurelia]